MRDATNSGFSHLGALCRMGAGLEKSHVTGASHAKAGSLDFVRLAPQLRSGVTAGGRVRVKSLKYWA